MKNTELQNFVEQNATLFWYTPSTNLANISLEFLVEQILNYGDSITIKQLFQIIGLSKVRSILENVDERSKGNYFPEIYNYFLLYTQRHAY